MPDKRAKTPEGYRDKIDEIQTSEKRENTQEVGVFILPDQTEELNFRGFLEKPLFGSYYLYPQGGDPSFKSSVFDSSQPFNGIKGRTFKEVEILRKVSANKIEAELTIEPISLNEWRYLFSKLGIEQLYGVTFFYVQTNEGDVRTIKVKLTKDGEGPYNYSLSLDHVSSEPIRTLPLEKGPYTNLKPRIIAPKK